MSEQRNAWACLLLISGGGLSIMVISRMQTATDTKWAQMQSTNISWIMHAWMYKAQYEMSATQSLGIMRACWAIWSSSHGCTSVIPILNICYSWTRHNFLLATFVKRLWTIFAAICQKKKIYSYVCLAHKIDNVATDAQPLSAVQSIVSARWRPLEARPRWHSWHTQDDCKMSNIFNTIKFQTSTMIFSHDNRYVIPVAFT